MGEAVSDATTATSPCLGDAVSYCRHQASPAASWSRPPERTPRPPLSLQDDSKRFSLVSILGGLLFAAGWWILIDGYSWGQNVCGGSPGVSATQGYAWLPLFGATIVFVMINGMKWSELDEDSVADPRVSAKARIFLIVALFIACGSVAGSGVLMGNMCVGEGDLRNPRRTRPPCVGSGAHAGCTERLSRCGCGMAGSLQMHARAPASRDPR